MEILLLKCRPFYLPREFSAVYIWVVYIPPNANAKLALARLQDIVNKSLVACPDSIFIAVGDFNHTDLKSVHSFHPDVKCAIKGRNTLDQVYTNIAKAYRTQAYLTSVSLTMFHSCYTLGSSLESGRADPQSGLTLTHPWAPGLL